MTRRSARGALAHYAAAGAEVTLCFCATRGEVGEIADPSFASPETLGQVREQELQCSVGAMGVDRLILLGYRDSGMVGTAENEDCRAYINAPEGEVIVRLVAILRQTRPHVVVTFEPNGGYGHPDHIAAHHHTVKAFHFAADPAVYPELGPAGSPTGCSHRHPALPFFRKMREGMVNLGMDTTDFDRRRGDNAPGWPDEEISAILDVSDSIAAKWDALQCHRTQFGPGNLFRRLPDATVKELMSHEYFASRLARTGTGAVHGGLIRRAGE